MEIKVNQRLYTQPELKRLLKNAASEVCIDLGCGIRKKEGHIGIDKARLEGVDIVCDIERGLPIEDNCVDKMYSVYFLEHVNDLVFIFQEIYRVCKNGAVVELTVPYYTSINAVKDPTHKQFFTEETFKYFSADKWYGSDYGINTNFKVMDIRYHYSRLIRGWFPEILKRCLRRYLMNMAGAMTVRLKVEK